MSVNDTLEMSIVMVTWNGWSHTDACLARLQSIRQTLDSQIPLFEVILADNSSTDETLTLTASKYPWVKAFATGANLGFGVANNLAVQRALSQHILLLNNDTLPTLDWLRAIWSSYKRLPLTNNQWGVLTTSLVYPDGRPQTIAHRDIRLGAFLTNVFRTESAAERVLYYSQEQIQGKVDGLVDCLFESHATAAVSWLMPRQKFMEVGGFDPRLFMYYEDTDFAWRARQQGARFFVLPIPTLVHNCGGSARNQQARAMQHDKSQRYLWHKRWGMHGLTVSVTFQILRSSLRILLHAIPALTGNKESLASIRIHWHLLLRR